MADTAIEWATKTWNPTTGCDRVSPGCDHCYALTMAKRLKGMGSQKYQRDGDPRTSGPGFAPTHHSAEVGLPLKWRKPERIFVNSMSDLFHSAFPDVFIARVWEVMLRCPQHTFMVLTKRHGRMQSLLSSPEFQEMVFTFGGVGRHQANGRLEHWRQWPAPNIWIGVSAENQQWADIRIPALLDTPAAIRFVSAEPLLGPIKLRDEWMGLDNGRPFEQGERYLPGRGVGRVVDRSAGPHLAACGTSGEPLGCGHGIDPVRTAAGRESIGEVPAGSSDVRRQADSCACSQAGMASLQRTYPTGIDGEPQERQALRQSAVELGACDGSGADQARSEGVAARQAESVRSVESDGEALHCSGSGDLFTSSGRGTAAGVGGRVRSESAGNIEDRSRRSPLAWLIVGGESGHGARAMHPRWARSLRDQCQAAGVAFLFKQWGEWGPAVWKPERLPGQTDDQYKAHAEAVGATHAHTGNPLGDGTYHLYEPNHRPWSIERGTLSPRDAHAGIRRWGKKRAGRELDGRTWDQYPAVVTV